MNININRLSTKYDVKKLEDDDVKDIFMLCCENRLYYEYCPPMVTEESIQKDMTVLPPNVERDDKLYIGFYADRELIAVMDLICGYPQQDIVYIGFFMTNTAVQKRGIGTEIISELCGYMKLMGYASVRLAWIKGNPQAEHFWRKNMFAALEETVSTVSDSVILAERIL